MPDRGIINIMHDIAVAGAGPAGASAARTAAGAGLSVVLLDKGVFPRHKPCGGALSEHALAALDFPLPAHVAEREYHGGILCMESSRLRVERPWRAGVLVARRGFDALLVDMARRAGAVVREGEEVLGLSRQADGVSLHTRRATYRARLAVVCEGASGRLKRAVRPPDRPEDYNYCVCADVPAEAVRTASGRGLPDPTRPDHPLVLQFGVSQVSYGWIFPRREDVSVGMGELGVNRRKAVADLRRFLADWGLMAPPALMGHKIPMGGVPRPIHRDRVLLAGDAGGFADPLLGEGIAHAIRTGQWAAQAAHQALDAGDPGRAGPIFERLVRPLDEEMRHALRLVRALERAPRRLAKAILTDEKALARYVDILSGRESYAAFTAFLKRRLPWNMLRTLWV